MGFVIFRLRLTVIIAVLLTTSLSAASVGQVNRVSIRVDTSKTKGELKPVWSFFGYDEPNYTYTKYGKKLLSELAVLSPNPVYVRTHNLLTTGDGSAALKWGSTNAYTEDVSGRSRYDWKIVDRIFDTYIERKMKPRKWRAGIGNYGMSRTSVTGAALPKSISSCMISQRTR